MEEENKELEDKEQTVEQKEKVGFVKKALKAVLYVVLGFFVLNSLLYVLLSIPFIQNKLVTFASNELSTMLKTEVTVSEVRFSLFNRASLKDLYIEDQSKDTLAYAKFVDARIKPIDFILKNRIRVNEVRLDDFYINITSPNSISDYNFQFIIDEFSSEDSTKVDTASSPLDVVLDDIQLTKGRLSHRIKSEAETPNIFNASDIYLTDLNASVSVHSIDMKKLDIHVNTVSAKEKSGLEITELKGHMLSEGSRLQIKNLALALPNSHLKTESVFYDLQSEEFEVVTNDTEIDPKDISPFVNELSALRQKINLKAKIKGKLPAIEAEKIVLTIGNEVLLDGDAYITSYEDLQNANIGVRLNKLTLSPQGIASLAKLGDQSFQMPAMLDSLGTITLNGRLEGQLGKFHLDTKAAMRAGVLNLIADGGIDTTFTNFDVKAKLHTTNYNLVPLVGKKSGLGRLSMHVNLDAHQKGAGNLVAKVKGAIDSLDMLHGKVKELPFAGYYDKHKMGFGADAKLHFGHIMAGFEMSNNTAKPDIKLGMRIKDIDVAHFYTNKLWDKPLLSFDVKGEIKKLDIDNLNADITVKNLQFVDTDFNFIPGAIELKAWQDTAQIKYITLASSILSANITGDYKFSTLSEELSALMHDYLSNVFPEEDKKLVNANDFTFGVTVHNTEELGYIFDLPIDIVEPLTLDGTINTKLRTIGIKGDLSHARNSMFDIRSTKMNMVNVDSAFNIKLNSAVLMDESTYDLELNVRGADNSLRSILMVDSDTLGVRINGKVDALGQFTINDNKQLVSFFQIIPTDVKVGNFILHLLPAKVINVNERTEVHNFGIGVNRKKYLNVSGAISENREDSLRISFNKAQIADVLQGLNVNDVYAEIDGDILATNLLDVPEFYANHFKIRDIILYKDTVGTVDIDTRWNQELGGIKLASTLVQKNKKVIELEGLVDPSKETLDLHMDIERFSIAWLKPFMKGVLSDISGDVSSHFTIKGTLDEPITEGYFGFNNTKIGIDYTNVTYYISDTIDITPQRIGFDNLVLKDNEGNTGIVNARVTHRNFKDVKYTLDMRAQNLMVLNTQSRTDSLFYGRLFASGTVKINGSDSGIDMNMQLRNGKKSNLNITIPQVSEATDYHSVVYINVPEDKLPKEDKKVRVEEPDIPIRIKLKLDVDPEIELGVVIDPQTGDHMTIKGNGTVNFNYDMQSQNMTLFGDYKATDGGVRLNLKNVSKLEFKIKEGSRLDFIGDPFKTKFNITAYRRVRADLRTLDQSFELDTNSPRVQVDCLLGITGDINKMDLSYDIELYDGSDDQARKVKSLVSTDELRIKQFAYLIASGTFYSNTNSSGANFSDGMWTSLASSALSSGLNSVFGSMLGDNWEIGTDFSSGDGSFSDMDMSVNATTKLFNDKLKLHANVGYRSENSTTTNDSFIGDFDAEYMLNSTWTLKAYSHTNDRFYRQAATTQGIGIVFTREGATFKKMFQSFKQRRGQWANRSRTSDSTRTHSRVVDSIGMQKKIVEPKDSTARDSVLMISPQKDSTAKPTGEKKKGIANLTQSMPMVVVEERQPAIREEEE